MTILFCSLSLILHLFHFTHLNLISLMTQFPEEQSEGGDFQRQEDAFNQWVTADGSSGFPAEKGRYHLYVCYACPWAHRTIILRKLKKLEDCIGMTAVDPIRDERGWRFNAEDPELGPDPVNGWKFLSEAYRTTDPEFHGRITVPVLWDKMTGRIVSNNDDHLMRMLDSAFDAFTDVRLNLVPPELEDDIDALNETIYETINNGVYQAGFAGTQEAYERAVVPLFQQLDQLDDRLRSRRYLFGNRITETDWRLFVTLVRFDPVYVGHFKCNLRQIREYPNLHGYLRDLYQQPGVAGTVNFDHIKRHYYRTHPEINPTRIVALGPRIDLDAPHDRESLQTRIQG